MILNIYPYGSRVYGNADEKSDTDLIVITDFSHEQETQIKWPGTDLTIWTAAEFQRLLNEHEPSALECYFLPKDLTICSRQFEFNLDLAKLRKAFSAKSSNSWVKAKKKIEVHGEWRVGLKSLFHSLRILDFGIQIAKYGKIEEYTRALKYWDTIMIQYDPNFNEDLRWEDFKNYWQPQYNALRTAFRLAAPLKED